MKQEYKNISLNLNSKCFKIDEIKFRKKKEQLLNEVDSSVGHTKALAQYKLDVLLSQYTDLKSHSNLGAVDFKSHRRLTLGGLLDDRYHELVAKDVIEGRHINMCKVDLTKNLPLVLSYTFNLNYAETLKKLTMFCNMNEISVEYLSYCILSQSRQEVLNCDIALGDLWVFFPEIKVFLGELCRASELTGRCLIDCISPMSYNSILGVPVNDEETQLMTALSLKLVLAGQDIVKECIVKIDDTKAQESYLKFYSQYICGCIFGTNSDKIPELYVTNKDNKIYIVPIEVY